MKHIRIFFTGTMILGLTLLLSNGIADEKEGGKRDNPEAKAGPRDGEGERKGPRDGEGKPKGPRDGEGGKKPEGAPRDGQGKPVGQGLNTKEGKIFVAYDKNRNGSVSDEEIIGMMEGKQNSRSRREIGKAVDRADKDNDGALNYDEFVWWMRVGRADERARNR